MKKLYATPETKLVKMEVERILAGSDKTDSSIPVDGDLAPYAQSNSDDDLWDEDE